MRDFSKAKKIVVKIGTNVLSNNGSVDIKFMKDIARQVSSLVKEGKHCIIVSSGAIGFGAMQLKMKKSQDIKVRQALAAIGQRILMEEYAKAFSSFNIEVAQILLTYDILTERKTNLNLKHSLNELLRLGVVPIINENDVVSIEEIGTKFGDNDRLSALVASKVDAELLILLSDIDGLYTDNPKQNKDAQMVDVVDEITPAIKKYAGKQGSMFAVGGMESKIKAAEIATMAGCSMIITHGREKDVILRAVCGEKLGTLFIPKLKVSARKRWILNALPRGKIIVNECAIDILKKGKVSLLPIGIVKVEGNFKAGDVVAINDFAHCVPDIDAKDIDKIKGLKSEEACAVLGKKCRNEVVKKENIVLL